jgi:sulfane dehydrogenase subunit SoxC
VQGLISGTFQRWWPNVYSTTPTVMFGSMGYEFSTPFLCFAGQPMEQEPRPAWNNNSSFTNANVSSTTWLNFYGVISLANDGLQALDRGVSIGVNGADNSRARAFAKFMQGVAHGYLALMWDKAVIIDEHSDVDTLATPTYSPYPEVMAAAIGMLKQSIAISDTATFTLPNAGWIPGLTYTNKDLSRLAHTFIARFETYVARTATERAAVNWQDVIAQADAGITADFAPIGSPTGLSDSYKQVAARVRTVAGDYMRGGYWLVGPADSTEGWKNWVATPVANRVAFQMRSQDRRIIGSAGPTAPGTYFAYDATSRSSTRRAARISKRSTISAYGAGDVQQRTARRHRPAEMDMLKAEALVRLNRATEAIRSSTRRASPTASCMIDINGPPDVAGCVPRKPPRVRRIAGRVALKTYQGAGVDGQVAYWDARGWKTLAQNSFINSRSRARARDSATIHLHVWRRRSGQRADAHVGQVSGIRDASEVLIGQRGGEQASPPPASSSRADGPVRLLGDPTVAVGSRAPSVQPARSPAGAVAGSSFTPLQDLVGTITPADLHFEVHHARVPAIDPARHSLLIHGLVDHPTLLSLADLKRFPQVTRTHFIECAGNGVLAWRVGVFGKPSPALTPQQVAGMTSNSEWTGVPLRTLLEEVGARRNAKWFLAEGGDACLMARSIPIEKGMDDALVVWAQNGEPLRPEQGFPMRLLLPGWEGNTNVKWLRRLELGTRPWMTRWETATYTDPLANGTARQFSFEMDARSIITSPAHPETIERGWRPISGLAWSGRGKIARVDVSTDSGNTWRVATLDEPVRSKAHTRFTHMWEWTGAETIILSRATDETGYVQPTRAELMRVRGAGTEYHFNPIYGWRVMPNGRLFFHGAT